MDYCDHCGTDITNVSWFFIKECDSAPQSRVCKSCNTAFEEQCKADLEYGEYLDDNERYEKMFNDSEDLAYQFYVNLTGRDNLENMNDHQLYDQLTNIATKCVCVQQAY